MREGIWVEWEKVQEYNLRRYMSRMRKGIGV